MSAYSQLVARMCQVPEGQSLAGAEFVDHLDALAQAHHDHPEWRHSLMGLLKILDRDCSYGARKALALELGYAQELIDLKGSTDMNLWVFGELMRRLAEDGAAVPPELLG